MAHTLRRIQGFTLIELIAVMVIAGILAGVVASRSLPQSTLQLQGGRDLLIAALFSAQQKAMSQTAPVRLLTQGNAIDIRIDSNGDGQFTAAESVKVNGVQYPVSLPANITLSNQSFDFNSLGHTSAGTVSVNRGGTSVNVVVTGTGYAF